MIQPKEDQLVRFISNLCAKMCPYNDMPRASFLLVKTLFYVFRQVFVVLVLFFWVQA